MILREIYEEINCVAFFQNNLALWMVRIWLRNGPANLWNLLTKIQSYTNHAWKWVLCYKLLWFYWNVLSFNIFHHDAWWFFYLIIEWNTTPLVKGRTRHFSHVRLCCDCRAAWASDTATRSAAVMGRARDSWCSKPLALVSREIIGYSKYNLNTRLLFHSCYFPLQMRNLQDPFTAHDAVC